MTDQASPPGKHSVSLRGGSKMGDPEKKLCLSDLKSDLKSDY